MLNDKTNYHSENIIWLNISTCKIHQKFNLIDCDNTGFITSISHDSANEDQILIQTGDTYCHYSIESCKTQNVSKNKFYNHSEVKAIFIAD